MNQITLLRRLPAVAYVEALLGVRMAALSDARRRGDAGASAIELAVITAVLVALAIGVTAVILKIVSHQCDVLNKAGAGNGGKCT